MKTIKWCKYNTLRLLDTVKIYYFIFIFVLKFLVAVSYNSRGSMSSSGLEFATVVFLFIAGLNSFTNNFRFSQANSLSRYVFFKGTVLSILPIAFIMSVTDFFINRIYNIFVPCPTNYDMIYTSYRITGMYDWLTNEFVWVQSNEFQVILGTILWQFAIYVAVFLTGLLITLIYYRSSKIMKFIVTAIPIIIFMFFRNIYNMLSEGFIAYFKSFITFIFGWESRNPYAATVTFLVYSMILTVCLYALIRKAVIKN